jgi:transcriptional regulator with XRE-family HTH domain
MEVRGSVFFPLARSLMVDWLHSHASASSVWVYPAPVRSPMISDQVIPASYRLADGCSSGAPMKGMRTLVRMTRGSPKDPTTDYGQRLRDAREAAGLTQSQLAKAADLTQATIGELERKGMGSRHTAKLADACGVRAEWLATGALPIKAQALSADVARLAAGIDALPKPERDRMLLLLRGYLEMAQESVNREIGASQKDAPASPHTELPARRRKAG